MEIKEMDNPRINLANNKIVIIETQAHYYEAQRWRHFSSNRQMAKEQEQHNIAKAASEIVATFYDDQNVIITSEILHRKLLHLSDGGVIEGFFTDFNEQFISVETNAFDAELKKTSVYVKELSTTHYEKTNLWWIKPVVTNITARDEVKC